MGRPLAKRFFGNTNPPYADFAQGGPTGTGGEGVAAVALGTAGAGYSKGLTAAVTAPQLPGGTTATVTVATNGTGAITGYTVTNAGGGYTAPPTVSLVLPANATPTATGNAGDLTVVVSSVTGIFVGMAASDLVGGVGAGAVVVSIVKSTKTVTLSVVNAGPLAVDVVTFTDAGAAGVPGAATLTAGPTARPNAIVMTAWTTIASSAQANCDIKKQVGSRRYKLTSPDGVGVCHLYARVPAAVGECSLIATDSHGSTYYVTKLTRHKARLTQKTMVGAFEFATDTDAIWVFDTPVLGYSVVVDNL